MQFYTQANGGSNSERARITSDGYFLIGTTSVAATVLDGTGGSNNALVIGDTGNPYPVSALQSSHQNWLADYITNDGSLRTYNTTSNYETMITTTAGAVTFPKTPSVHAEQVASNSGGGAVCIFTSTFHNIGGHYNTSNGRFTAPVAGRYLVTCSLLFNPDTNGEYARMLLAKNGATDTNYWDTLQDLNLSSLADYWAQNASCVIQLAANDYLEVQNQSQFSTYGGSYSQFCVHLLG